MYKGLALLVGASMMAFAVPSVFDRYVAEMRQSREESIADAQAATNAAASRNEALSQTAAPTHGGRVAEVEAGPSGHFEVTASLNGRPVDVLIDTGATYVALSETQARALGIRVRADAFRHTTQTANGPKKVAIAMLDRVRIGSVEVRDVEATVTQGDGLPVTLLGMSFLSKLKRFEVRSNRMSLVQ